MQDLGSILASSFSTYSSGVDYCAINTGGSRYHRRNNPSEQQTFQMKGKNVFALVMREFPGFFEKILYSSKLSMNEIDLFVPHQASHSALEHMQKKLNIPDEKWVNIYSQYGNQVAASLPTALHLGLTGEKIKRGSKIMLMGSGAGITLGAMILEF